MGRIKETEAEARAPAARRYRVILPIDVGGRVYGFGEIAELEMDTAVDYAHALIPLKEEDDGRNG